jgi:hypothetical protein
MATVTITQPFPKAYLQDLLNGAKPTRDLAEFDGWQEMVETWHAAHKADDTAGVRRVWSVQAKAQPELAAAMASEEAEVPDTAERSDVPALPDSARPRFDIGNSYGDFVDETYEYLVAVSPMTPATFLTSAGIVLGSMTIARRLKLPMPFGDVFPNLFVAWIAPTTLYRKTTAYSKVRTIARETIPHLLASQDATPESLIADMAGREPTNVDSFDDRERDEWLRERVYAAQKGMFLDEMSSLLNGAGRDYQAGQIEALMRFYDCDPHYVRSTRGQGRITVRNASLSMLGVSTPSAVAPHVRGESLWANGWWPRFALLSPEDERPAWVEPRHAEISSRIPNRIRTLDAQLGAPTYPEPVSARSVVLGPGVHEAWGRYNKATSFDLITSELDERLWGAYGRLAAQVLKVAMILVALDWKEGPAPIIAMIHLARAIHIVEDWRASAHRTLRVATRTSVKKLQLRLYAAIARAEPQGETMRDLCKGHNDQSVDDIEDALRQMEVAGEIVRVPSKPGPKGGRPTERFRIARA